MGSPRHGSVQGRTRAATTAYSAAGRPETAPTVVTATGSRSARDWYTVSCASACSGSTSGSSHSRNGSSHSSNSSKATKAECGTEISVKLLTCMHFNRHGSTTSSYRQHDSGANRDFGLVGSATDHSIGRCPPRGARCCRSILQCSSGYVLARSSTPDASGPWCICRRGACELACTCRTFSSVQW